MPFAAQVLTYSRYRPHNKIIVTNLIKKADGKRQLFFKISFVYARFLRFFFSFASSAYSSLGRVSPNLER